MYSYFEEMVNKMTTIVFILTDGTSHDLEVAFLTREQAFEALQDGRMSFEQFEEWVGQQTAEAYADGADNQSEVMVMGYDY